MTEAPPDFRTARRNGHAALEAPDPDRLPPHSLEAEQGALGCVLLNADCLADFERQRVEPGWFYDLRHRHVYETLGVMREKGMGIDPITLTQRLRDNGHLEAAGGLAYVAGLPDATPSAANLGHYLDILREKFVLRRVIAESTDAVGRAYDFLSGDLRAFLDVVRGRLDQCAQVTFNPSEASTLLRPAGAFAEAVFNKWFGDGAKEEEPGMKLPETAFGTFPFRIRFQEMTLVLGEKGKGKTTMLSYIALHLAAQLGAGERVVVASMEMAPADTLETLARQLLGVKRCPDSPSGQRLYQDAVGWLNARCEILDFRGIIQHRQLLDEFKRGVDRGGRVFVVDNIMKLGLMEDDMAAHGQAANEFHGFAVGHGAHVFMVNHLNKGGTSRGSLRWVDASNNVVSIDRNEKKWEKLGPGFQALEQKAMTREEFAETYEKELKDWDAKFTLKNQRLQGSLQNGSRTLWFLFHGSQYANHAEPLPKTSTNWLAKWTPAKASGHPDGQEPHRGDAETRREDE
jgi:hypothetical protein